MVSCHRKPCALQREKKMGSNSRCKRQQRSLPWDPDLEEASVQPPHMIRLDPHFMVCHRRTSQRFDAKR